MLRGTSLIVDNLIIICTSLWVFIKMGQVLSVLGPGDHFGARWMDSFDLEVARARGVVRTVSMRRDQAPRLQEVLQSAGQLVAESGHFPAIVPTKKPD